MSYNSLIEPIWSVCGVEHAPEVTNRIVYGGTGRGRGTGKGTGRGRLVEQ